MRRCRLVLAAVACATWLVCPRAARADREACFASAESAQQLRAQGKLRGARDALLVCAQSSCPAAVQKDCARWLVEVKDAVPSIVFTAHDPHGNDLVDVSVSVDGERLLSRLNGQPIEVDPGARVVLYERVGSKPVTKSIVFAAGQKLREIAVQMETVPSAETATRAAPLPVPSIVLGAVGAAGLVSMTAFWVSGRSDFSTLQATCSPNCDPAKEDPVRAKLIVGDVSMGVAIVSLGLATWLFFARPRMASVPTVGVALAPRASALSLGLTF